MFIEYEHIVHGEIRKQIKAFNKSGLLDKRIMLIPKMTKNQLARAFILGIQQCFDQNTLDDVPDEVYDYYLSIAKPDKKRPADVESDKAEPSQERKKAIEGDKDAPPPLKIALRASENVKVAKPKRGRGRPRKTTSVTKPLKKPTKKASVYKKAEITKKVMAKKACKKIAKKKVVAKKVKRGPGRPRKYPKVEKPADGISRSAKTTKGTRAKVFADIVSDGKPRTKKQIVADMQSRYKGSNVEAQYWVGGYCGLLIALGKMVKRTDGTFIYSK